MARDLFGDNAFNKRRMAFILDGGGNSQQQVDPLLDAIKRTKGVFQLPANQPMNSSAPAPTSAEADADPLSQALKRMQGGQASTAYREHIGKMPSREQYAPSQTRRIGGALAAAAGAFNDPRAGAAIGEQIIGAPYRNALESWQMKGAGLSEQADMEQKDIKGQIEYIKRIQDQQQAERDYGLKERSTAADELRAQTDVARQRAQEESYKRQGWTKQVGADGIAYMFNPNTKEEFVLGPDIEGRRAGTAEYVAQTGRGQLGVAQGGLAVSQGNLGMRGQEFNYKMGQDAIQNAQRDRTIANSEYGTDINAMNAGAAGFVNAGENFTANAMAAQQVARTNPRFAGWSLDEQGMPVKPGSMWGTNPVDPASQDAKDYLAEVNRAREAVISTRRPGVGQAPSRRVQPPNLGGMGQGPKKFSDLNPGGGGGLKF